MKSVNEISKLCSDGYSTTKILDAHDDKSWKYFEFATIDLDSDDSDRSQVNAVSNAKRALHFRAESLADAFGSRQAGLPPHPSFPALLEYIKKCGIISPRILERLNSLRNRVEHRYEIPEKEVAEDTVDVVELFLYATDRLITSFPRDVDLTPENNIFPNVSEISCSLALEPGSGLIKVRGWELTADQKTLEQLARKELKKIKADLKLGKRPDDFYFPSEVSKKSLKEFSYRSAALKHYQNFDFEVFVKNDESFFDWVSLMLEKIRE